MKNDNNNLIFAKKGVLKKVKNKAFNNKNLETKSKLRNRNKDISLNGFKKLLIKNENI